MNLNTLPEQTANGVRLPRDIYGIRCIEAEFKVSAQKQTPYIALTWEVCTPETVKMAGKDIKVAGLKATQNFWLTEKAASRLKEFHVIMGLELDEINEQDAEFMKEYVKRYLGIGAKGVLNSKENKAQKEVVGEDGEIAREDMLDEDGKPIVSYSIEVANIRKRDDSLKVEVAY